MSKLTKNERITALEAQVKRLIENEKQRGIGNQFMTLKCIQGNRLFTKDATYCVSKLHDRTVITTNFGSRKGLEVNTNIFGGYKVTDDNQTAVFQVIGADFDPKLKLKQLDQSVFDGLDEKWRFAVICSDGERVVYADRPVLNREQLWWYRMSEHLLIDKEGYDTTDWQNSLIERESKELTGSDLCRKMLERGDKVVLCAVSRDGDFVNGAYDAICSVDEDGLFESYRSLWRHVQPVNNQGEPLTAREVGL